MDSSNSSEIAEDRVRRWVLEVKHDQGSTTSQLTRVCTNTFRQILGDVFADEHVSVIARRQLERSSSSFSLWEAGYGVADGTLDERIGASKILRLSILESLVSIGNSLAYGLMPLVRSDVSSESYGVLKFLVEEAGKAVLEISDDDFNCNDSGIKVADDDYDCDGSRITLSPGTISKNCDEIAEDLWTDVQCLLELDPLIESAVPDIIKNKKHKENEIVHLEHHFMFTDKIKTRFPKADVDLADLLARANWERFLEIRTDRNAEQNVPAAADKFKDSALGTSVNTRSLYAETTMSYRNEGCGSVRIPPLTESAKQGIPFECVACGKIVSIRQNSSWKKHLYSDLCPWVCLYPGCNRGSQRFHNPEMWVHHLSLEHSLQGPRGLQCPLCNDDLGDSNSSAVKHLSIHMEEISLAVLPRTVDEDVSNPESIDSAAPGTAFSLRTKSGPQLNASDERGGPPTEILEYLDVSAEPSSQKEIQPAERVLERKTVYFWRCCQCFAQDMRVDHTAVCMYCQYHQRCGNCPTAERYVRP